MADVAESPQRRSRDFRSQHEGEILKCTGSVVIATLREATKAAEESLCDLMRTKEELLVENDKLRNRIALLHDVNGKLVDQIAVQNEREVLILQDREKFFHEIHVRKKTKTLLIQERRGFFQNIFDLKERVRHLERNRELVLNTSNSRQKTKAIFLQVRKRLLNKIGAQSNIKTILLQERTEMIDCFSKKIRALKKRESQLLQERKKSEVKLHKALDKLRYHRDTAFDRTITILWDVTKKVLALTMDVEDSQLIGDKNRTPRSKSDMKMPSTLPSSWKQAKRMISRAEDAFCEAGKNWVRNRDYIEAMKIFCREGLINKILGRKERPSEAQAALRDILDENQTMERQPQTEHNILAVVELNDSEKAQQKENNPQRFETSPSPSSQEAEVCRKRKRIGTSPPPSSEEMKVPRSRRKPQKYGTSPPPRERMKVPRKRKRPQRYGASS